MKENRSLRVSVPKGSAIAKAAKVAAILVGVLVFSIYPSVDSKVVPSRIISISIAMEPASHVTGVEALELSARTSSARYTALATAFFEANPELMLSRKYSGGVSKSSLLERSNAASSARYTAMAASYLASNPELSLVRSLSPMAATSFLAANPELALVRSFSPDLTLPSALERSNAASSARYTGMAAAYLASNPELSLARSFKVVKSAKTIKPMWVGGWVGGYQEPASFKPVERPKPIKPMIVGGWVGGYQEPGSEGMGSSKPSWLGDFHKPGR